MNKASPPDVLTLDELDTLLTRPKSPPDVLTLDELDAMAPAKP